MASPPERPRTDYGSAGVDADAVEAGLAGLVRHVRATWPDADSGLGAIKVGLGYFASVLDFGGVGVAVCTDGIGTKALIAQMTGRYDTVGIDCVAMNVNDLICVGARPITLVDYVAVERAEPAMLTALGAGLAEGARRAGVSIAGGEIAAMRDVIKGAVPDAGFDLAGTAVGRVALDAVNTGAACAAGRQHRRHRQQRHPQQRPDPRPAGLLRDGGPHCRRLRGRPRRDRGRGAAPPHAHLCPRGAGPAGRSAGARAGPHHRRRVPQSDPNRGAGRHEARRAACAAAGLHGPPAAGRDRGRGDVPRLQHGHRLLRHRAGSARGPRPRHPRRARQGVPADRDGGGRRGRTRVDRAGGLVGRAGQGFAEERPGPA